MFHIELIIEFLENVMNNIVQVAILFFEFVGVIVIILSGLKGFYNYVRRVPDMKTTLAQGLAVGWNSSCAVRSLRPLSETEGDRYRSRIIGFLQWH